jgi:hypothetical protein
MNLIIFPSCRYYSYLKKYIQNYKIYNPTYAYYNFDKSDFCDFSYDEHEDIELRLNKAFEIMKKFAITNKEKEIKVYLFTPNISYYYDEKLDLKDYLEDNIVEFNYIVKESNRIWHKDFNDKWLNDTRVKFINL